MIRSVLSVLAGIEVLTVASFAIETALNPLLIWAFPEALPDPEALSSNLWVRALTFAYGLVCVWPPVDTSRLVSPGGDRLRTRL
jgi:hypothetical protein